MPSTKSVKFTLGGPESVSGTAESRTECVPLTDLPALDGKLVTIPDPAITGDNMDVGEYASEGSVAGSLPISFRPCAGIGMIAKGNLGSESTPTQIGAIIRIRYTGSSASCKITTTTGTIVSAKGTLGSESADNDFGTSGTITLSGATVDTAAELAAVIEAYADYEAEVVTGSGSAATTTAVAMTAAQGKNTWVYLYFTAAASGAYYRSFTPDLDVANERPTYTGQKDGFQSNFLYPGLAFDSLKIEGALKGALKASTECFGFTETAGEDASTVALDDVDPLMFYNGSTSIAGTDYTFIRNFSFESKNNHMTDGFGQGSIWRQYHQKGFFECSGDLQLRLDANSYAERAKIAAGTTSAISLYFKGKQIGTSGLYEMVIVEIPYARIVSFDWPENSGQIDAKISWKATKPKGSYTYNNPVTVTFVNADSAAY